jgi:hypothetical protein
MNVVREPLVEPVAIMSLRPTQMTVGMGEVAERRKRWRELKKRDREAFLARHMIPVIRGPKDRGYIVDHHHLALALHQEGVKEVPVTVFVDLHKLEPDEFWFTLDVRGWTFPFDARGKRHPRNKIPKTVEGLQDDPYRSLAGEIRRLGGFSKDTTPFSEFLWAEFLRRRIPHAIVDKNFAKALEQSYGLARSKDADYLPGWCGPVDGA